MVITPSWGSYDLSIMASLHCNLQCPHCQYNAGPYKNEWLDETIYRRFLSTVDWGQINSIGFYGGEVSLDLGEWAKYIHAVDLAQLIFWNRDKRKYNRNKRPKWCITNGSWSKKEHQYFGMIDFVRRYDLTAFISTTQWHKASQDYRRLKLLTNTSERFKFKKDDTKSRLLPMGRNYTEDWYCTRRCLRQEETERIAIKPNGDVIYQKCDGIYPVIANISAPQMGWVAIEYALHHQMRCPMTTADIGEPTWVSKAAAYFQTPNQEKRYKSLQV